MTDEEKEREGVQIKTNNWFTPMQIRWAAVILFGLLFGSSQIRSWLISSSLQQTANSAQTAADTATSKTSEIDAIKKDLEQTKAALTATKQELEALKNETRQQKLALESWSDLFLEEEIQQPPQKRERYRQQRLKVKEILKPIGQANDLHASPTLPTPDSYPVFKGAKND